MPEATPLSLPHKARLFCEVWVAGLRMEWAIRRRPIPALVASLAPHTPPRVTGSESIRQLRRAVDRSLKVGAWEPRCLVKALVLYRLLAERGIPADLVIGLPKDARSIDAHAWIEINGHDIGPRPGRSGHEEFARFGESTS